MWLLLQIFHCSSSCGTACEAGKQSSPLLFPKAEGWEGSRSSPGASPRAAKPEPSCVSAGCACPRVGRDPSPRFAGDLGATGPRAAQDGCDLQQGSTLRDVWGPSSRRGGGRGRRGCSGREMEHPRAAHFPPPLSSPRRKAGCCYLF